MGDVNMSKMDWKREILEHRNDDDSESNDSESGLTENYLTNLLTSLRTGEYDWLLGRAERLGINTDRLIARIILEEFERFER